MKIRIRIRNFKLIWTLSFLLYYLPESYVIGSSMTTLKNYLMIGLSFLLLLLEAKIYREKIRTYNRSTTCLAVLFLWVLVGSTLLNNLLGHSVSINSSILYISGSMGLLMLCDIGYMYSEKDTLKSFLNVGIIMCTLNALSFFYYYKRGGMVSGEIYHYGKRADTQVYFLLGRDNATFFFVWPVIVVSWYYYFKYSRKIKSFVIFGLSSILIIASYFYTWSVLAAFTLLFEMILVVIIAKNDKGKLLAVIKKLKFSILWEVGLIFNILLSAQIILKYLLPIITNVYRKSETLSRRTFIWERSYKYIFRSPIIGYGSENQLVTTQKIGINHTHNMFLEILYRGGAIGLVLFLLYCIVLSREQEKITDKGPAYEYVLLSIFIFFISCSVEFAFYRYHFLIVFLILAFNTDATRVYNERKLKNSDKERV